MSLRYIAQMKKTMRTTDLLALQKVGYLQGRLDAFFTVQNFTGSATFARWAQDANFDNL